MKYTDVSRAAYQITRWRMPFSPRAGLFGLVLGLAVTGNVAIGQELAPRAYWPAPVGTNVLTTGYAYTTGDIVPDPSLPITGLDSDISTLKVSFLRALSIAGRSANITFVVPYSDGTSAVRDLNDSLILREYQGVGDITAGLSVNLLGAPAMTPQDFAAMRQSPRPILGASVRVVAPTGRYQNDRIINVGSNRWATKLELGYIQPLPGKWMFEASLGAWLFDDNDDFLGFTKEQDPIGALEMHLVHRFKPGFWGSFDANFYTGGRSRVDGVRLNDLQRDSKIGVTLAFPIARRNLLRAGYSYGSVNDKDESFRVFQVSWSHLF